MLFFLLRKDHCYWESIEACCWERLKTSVLVNVCARVCVAEKSNLDGRCCGREATPFSASSPSRRTSSQKTHKFFIKKFVFKQTKKRKDQKKKRNRVHTLSAFSYWELSSAVLCFQSLFTRLTKRWLCLMLVIFFPCQKNTACCDRAIIIKMSTRVHLCNSNIWND